MLKLKKRKYGEYQVRDGKRLVGIVRRSSRSVRHPSGKMVRVGTWVALAFYPNLRQTGPHVGTRREAVALLATETPR